MTDGRRGRDPFRRWGDREAIDRRRRLRAGALTLLLLLTAHSAVRAQEDGGPLMRKMIDAYHHLDSYTGTSNVDQIMTANNQVMRVNANAVEMRYRRPNKLVLIIQNPGRSGTRSLYSDGTSLVVYDAIPALYSRGPTAPTLAALLPLMRQRAHVAADLDPLFFLAMDRLPPTVTKLRRAGVATVNGRSCYIVTGIAPQVTKYDFGKSKGTTRSGAMHWSWYIDKKTFLLTKVEAHSDPIPVTGLVRKGKATIKQTVNLVTNLRHTVVTMQVDPGLADDAFRFTPPPGTTEQKKAAQMTRGGQ